MDLLFFMSWRRRRRIASAYFAMLKRY